MKLTPWRAGKRLLGVGALVLAGPLAACAVLYLLANGPTAGAVALSSLPWFSFALAALCLSVPTRRACGVLLSLSLGYVLFDAGYIALRARETAPEGSIVYCADGSCGAPASLWQRVPPEGEVARLGLMLARWRGRVGPQEASAFASLLRAEYTEPTHLPNTLLLRSSGSTVRYLQSIPRDKGSRAPVLVFLHGFGGLLTPYVRAMADSPLGERFVILAPSIGPAAEWWRGRGAQVLERLLSRCLPPEADPNAVFLVGLSNGAVGATELAARMPGRLRGVVLLSGITEVNSTAAKVPPHLVFAGLKDERFPAAWVEGQVDSLRRSGVPVELHVLPADHFLILTQRDSWTAAANHWLEGLVPPNDRDK